MSGLTELNLSWADFGGGVDGLREVLEGMVAFERLAVLDLSGCALLQVSVT